MEDRLAIAEVVQNWAVWRDAGDWARFSTVWHPDELGRHLVALE